jgi:hypothetical protein
VKTCIRWAFILSAPFWLAAPTRSQSLGNAGAAHIGLIVGVR